jgi:hypothetical protein
MYRLFKGVTVCNINNIKQICPKSKGQARLMLYLLLLNLSTFIGEGVGFRICLGSTIL